MIPLTAALINHTSAIVCIDIAVIIVVARVMGSLFRRIRQPAVIGEIVGGLLLGPSFLGAFPGHLTVHLFPLAERPGLQVLADLGVVLFMFIVGLEVDPRLIKGNAKRAASISLASIVLPFGLGAGLAVVTLHQRYGFAANKRVDLVPFAFFIGASMSITAFPVLARILSERGIQRTELGTLALACAAVDDLMAWSLLAVVIGIVESKSALDLPRILAEVLAFVAVMLFAVRPILSKAFERARSTKVIPLNLLAAVLVLLLASAWTTDEIGVHLIFGAFIFGAAGMPKQGYEVFVTQIVDRIESATLLLLLPIFFVITGLSVNVRTIGLTGLASLVLILAAAILGKFIGAAGSGRLLGLSHRQAGAIGILMNTRGLTELIILNVGLSLGVLSPKLFTLMVIMAVTTTVMTDPLLRWVYPDRMLQADLADAERLRSGGVAPGYQVLVVVDRDGPAPAVNIAAELAGPGGGVLVSRLLAHDGGMSGYSGMAGELGRMAAAVDELNRLGRQYPDVLVRHSVKFTSDIVEEILGQIDRAHVDALVMTVDSAGDPGVTGDVVQRAPCHVVLFTPGVAPDDGSVVVAVSEGADGDTAFEIGVRLAMGRSGRDRVTTLRLVPLAPGAEGRCRRLAGRLRGLGLAGVQIDDVTGLLNGGSPLLVTGFAASGTGEGGPRVAVRSADDPERVGMDLHFTRLSAQVRVSTEHAAAHAALKAAEGTP